MNISRRLVDLARKLALGVQRVKKMDQTRSEIDWNLPRCSSTFTVVLDMTMSHREGLYSEI